MQRRQQRDKRCLVRVDLRVGGCDVSRDVGLDTLDALIECREFFDGGRTVCSQLLLEYGSHGFQRINALSLIGSHDWYSHSALLRTSEIFAT